MIVDPDTGQTPDRGRTCSDMPSWAYSSQTSRTDTDTPYKGVLSVLAAEGRHHLELAEAHMPGIGLAPGGPMAVKDVCDLQGGATASVGGAPAC
jgi:hypothetical protein